MRVKNKSSLKYAIVGAWLIFTSTLAGWWYIFGVAQARRVIELDRALTPEMTRHLNMLAWEGATLFFCIVLGGGTLMYFMIKEERQRRRLQAFFSTFTHELKTPLASLRLQAESLKEDLAGSPHATLIDRLTSDTERLTMQLENSLFLANERSRELLLERIPLREIIQSTVYRWPNLVVTVGGDAIVHADSRALECILTNLIQNAVTHGRASEMTVTCSRTSNSMLQLSFRDNGVGFSGEPEKLGGLFSRFYSGSGNGIGLYLVRSLARQMRGDVRFVTDQGFEVQVTLPGEFVAA